MKIKYLVFVLLSCLCLQATAQENIVDRLNKTLGVLLPTEYEAKIREFATNDTIMRTRSATAYTEQFIIEEMKQDWGISKQNQLLFIWSKIYGGISEKKLYDWLNDDNKDRSGDYKRCLKDIANFYDRYKKGFKEYMDNGISEADRRIREADSMSAQYRRESAEADNSAVEALNNALNAIVEFYYSYNILSDNNRLESFKPKVKKIVSLCKEYGIDYTKKLSPEMLKLFGVE